MFTPPPQSEADAVRVIIGYYDPLEVLMAYYMQTSEGQPYNVMLFFSQYQTVDEYMENNDAAAIAGQIDWWTRTRIYSTVEEPAKQPHRQLPMLLHRRTRIDGAKKR